MEPTSSSPNQNVPAVAPVRDYSALYMPVAIVLAGLLIAGGLYMGLSGGGAPAGAGGKPAPVAVNVKDVKTANTPFIGNPDAKAVMAYWSDYQCPFCKQSELSVMPEIIEKYVDTGKLKIVFKDFAFLGQDSITAASYGHAVWDLYPDKYFEWREAVYAAQDEEGDQGFGDAASIDKLTKTIGGIDASKVAAYVAKNKEALVKEVQAETAEGSSFGVNGTPGFIIGKQKIDGAVPVAQFIAAIEAALK